MQEILLPLDPDEAAHAGREITRFKHRLAETGLFTDEALARLIDETPRELVTICTMRPNPPPTERWIAGDADGLSGGELIEAAKHGNLWVSPRSAMTRSPAYRKVFDQLMGEFSKATGAKVLTADGAILISSARMGIFFHVDAVETMLWHVRGHKAVKLYPPREDHISDESLEAVLLKQNVGELPYRPQMEEGAAHVELAPGEGVYWPMHSPHRVLNGDDLNVSVSIEFASVRSTLTNGVYYVNGQLRRRLGLAAKSRGAPGVLKPAYWVGAKALKLLAPLPNIERAHPRQFDVDLTAPGCIRWREGVTPLAA